MRFQGRGANESFERLFLVESVGYFENRSVGLSCVYECSDLFLSLPTFIHSMLVQFVFRTFERRSKTSEPM
jgi:hypothetical protein